MKRPTQSPLRRAGFTLVELLVALALAVVITALVLTMLAITNAARRGQAERAACLADATRPLQQLARDLERTFLYPKNEDTAFKMARGTATSNAVLELAFARTAAVTGETDLRWAQVERVSYRLVEADVTNFTLVCTSHVLVGPAALQPPVTNAVFQGLENFDVLLYDGKDWKDNWTGGSNATNGAPSAARITVTARRGGARHTATAEVIIPVSMKFEPPKKDKVSGKDISEIK
ncbi:MAG: prepilin-type N-terminal cleavage/methylation domain-containing protein [Kiritimatiellaeota bacterium]|nr:prepilin-type N-terminal cleavage/methylation domain-containing protein [Kiritimatiellota bacterium]